MALSLQPWLQIGHSWQRESAPSCGWRERPVLRGVMLSPDPEAVLDSLGDEEPSEPESDRTGSTGRSEALADYHESVLLAESVAALAPEEGKRFFDGTLGGGGHSEALLSAGAEVLACDQDPEAIAYASARLSRYGDRFSAVHANFSRLDQLIPESGWGKVDGVILDLGVSSRHLDAPERGFSFMNDGPLDMRMNGLAETSAASLVNTLPESELARIFWEFGEERGSRRIARAIVERRSEQPFSRTAELADLVASIVPRMGKKHPATRVFQALRIAVNEELAVLVEALGKVADCLKPGGVLAVITFHSLEDRIVKQFLRRHSEEWIDRPEWPAPKPNPERFFKLPSRKPIPPTEAEVDRNPRARSAKLRVGVRV